MNTNEIRFYLHNYERLKKEIDNLKESLTEYRLMDGVKAQQITDMPVEHGGADAEGLTWQSKPERIVLTRLEYVQDLENEIDSKMRIYNAINSVYYYLKEPARTIIEMRYFITPMENDVRRPKYGWKAIADEISYSEIRCKEIDGKVVRKIQQRLQNTYI